MLIIPMQLLFIVAYTPTMDVKVSIKIVYINYKKSFTELKKAAEPFCALVDQVKNVNNFAAEANNGEYLIRRGTYTVSGNPKTFEFEHIYKKVNGTYLMYHDEFSFE